LKSFWIKHHTQVDSAVHNIAGSAARLPQVMAQIDSALTTTRKLMVEIENQNGTVGKVIYDDELYRKANQITDDLQALLNQMKKNPGKFVDVSMIRFF
ncbi:MAG: hypothetical protein ONA90_09570, partial [candidate division KSB1 bacterium]|nr:hypothetical protein [candidate division KSB1 bacterium]